MNETYISSFDWMPDLCINFYIRELVKRYFHRR